MADSSLSGWAQRRINQLTSLGGSLILLLAVSLSALPVVVAAPVAADSNQAVCTDGTVAAPTFPGAPTLLTPSNDSNLNNGFDFTWSAEAGATAYDWESSFTPAVNPDGSFTQQLAYHRLDTPGLNEGNSQYGTYYWHARGVAADGTTGSWSQIWKVTIYNNGRSDFLSAPTQTYPADGAVCDIAVNDFYFTWDAPLVSDGSTLTYQYQSGQLPDTDPTTGDFTNNQWNDFNLTSPTVFDGNSASATYYWHVRAITAGGEVGPWSATRVVTINHDVSDDQSGDTSHDGNGDDGQGGDTTPPSDPGSTGTPSDTSSQSDQPAHPAVTPQTLTNGSLTGFTTDSGQVLGDATSDDQPAPVPSHQSPKHFALTAEQTAINPNWMSQHGYWLILLTLLLSLTGSTVGFYKASTPR